VSDVAELCTDCGALVLDGLEHRCVQDPEQLQLALALLAKALLLHVASGDLGQCHEIVGRLALLLGSIPRERAHVS
jgi:hypothetical protein